MVTRHILIEDLVRRVPGAVTYLAKKNIKCLACGEPIWGTLEEAAREKGFSDEEIAVLLTELNALGGDGQDRQGGPHE
jgi:hypothetical protein